MRRIICLTGLVLAVGAPSAGARPAPPDSPPPASSQAIAEPTAPSADVASVASTDDGLDTGWIIVLASGGAAVAAGVGFAGGRRQGHRHVPTRG
jgi:hypothetical protein